MLTGFDVSNNQPNINPRLAHSAGGQAFVFCKASEGTGFTDPLWVAGRPQAARAAGLKPGAYHYAHLVNDPHHEASHFLHALDQGGGRRHGDLPCCLDFEDPANPHDKHGNYAWIDIFSRAVHQHTGRGIVLYTGPYYADEHLDYLPPLARVLWIAAYPSLIIPQVARRSGGRVLFHQYSDHGHVPGVPAACDVDVFYGSRAHLWAFCRK